MDVGRLASAVGVDAVDGWRSSWASWERPEGLNRCKSPLVVRVVNSQTVDSERFMANHGDTE